ncbi:Gfo/Idh/MocA family protein [Longispora urticae]
MDGNDGRLRVAVIGLGGIAQKAYLPTLGARPGLDLHLMTRDPAKLDRIADTYRVAADRRFTDLGDLLARPLDAAFVHAPTDQHRAVVGRLLDAGIPTYVDKPLDSTLEGSRALVERAERTGTTLMVGFNRRYVPAYVRARERPRDLIILQKNQAGGTGAVREIVYDDFIHVVDTLRFLLPGPAEHVHVSGRVEGTELHHVVLTLSGGGGTAIGVMHRNSGSKEERLEVMGGGGKREVVDLVDETDHDGYRARRPVDGWTPVATQRGIAQICTEFLDTVRAGGRVDLRDALRTHELCERVVLELLRSSGSV